MHISIASASKNRSVFSDSFNVNGTYGISKRLTYEDNVSTIASWPSQLGQ